MFPRQEFAFCNLAVLPDRYVAFVRILVDIHIQCSCTTFLSHHFLSPKRGFFWMWFQAETSSPPLLLPQSLLFSDRFLRIITVLYSIPFLSFRRYVFPSCLRYLPSHFASLLLHLWTSSLGRGNHMWRLSYRFK